MTSYLIKINEFCNYMAEHGRKTVTVDSYRSPLKMCFLLLEQDGRPTEPSKIREEDVFFLKDNLKKSERTVKHYIRVLSLFLKHNGIYLIENMHILWNRELDNQKFITWKDFSILYKRANPPQRLVLVLGAMMGLRRSEMAQIHLDDIHRTTITVHGKGHGPEGLVSDQPMPPEVKREISLYLKWRNQIAKPSQTVLLVWPSVRRSGVSVKLKQHEKINEHMNYLRNDTGIDFTPHALRRLYATTLYKNNTDILVIRDLLRHSDVSTTQRYIQRDVDRAFEAANSVGRFLGGVLNI